MKDFKIRAETNHLQDSNQHSAAKAGRGATCRRILVEWAATLLIAFLLAAFAEHFRMS